MIPYFIQRLRKPKTQLKIPNVFEETFLKNLTCKYEINENSGKYSLHVNMGRLKRFTSYPGKKPEKIAAAVVALADALAVKSCCCIVVE